MLSLIIDTSTERECAAFFDGHEILFQGLFPFGLNSSKYLLPEIERGFNTLGKTAHDLDYVAVGIGPGSYTGIRVGAMVAKTLVYAVKKPLVTFCSLEAFLPSKTGSFAVLLDAKIGGAYVMKGVKGKAPQEPKILPLNDLGEYLSDVKILVTPNMSVIKQKIEDLYPDNTWIWEEKSPDILHLGHLTSDKFAKGDYSDNVELLYLRKTQAEMEKG